MVLDLSSINKYSYYGAARAGVVSLIELLGENIDYHKFVKIHLDTNTFAEYDENYVALPVNGEFTLPGSYTGNVLDIFGTGTIFTIKLDNMTSDPALVKGWHMLVAINQILVGTINFTAINGAVLESSSPVSLSRGQFAIIQVVASVTQTSYRIYPLTERSIIYVDVGDETTALTTGTAKKTFRMPYAMRVIEVRASVTTAPTDANLIVDINEGGTSIMTTTKLSIDAGEKTSTTAATAPVITDTLLAEDAEMTVDIDQIGSSVAGSGLKIQIHGLRH